MESSHYTCRINGAQVGGPYESISAAKRAASRLAHRHNAPVEVSEMLIHQGHAIESIPDGYRVLPYGETFPDLDEARHWIDEHVRHEVRALERRQNPLRLRDYGRKFRSVGDVRIYFDPDYGEYAVIPAGATDDSGIYFTDDRQDAIATAQAMGMR